MNTLKHYLAGCFAGLVIVSMPSCTSPPQTTSEFPTTSPSTAPSVTPSPSSQPMRPSPEPTAVNSAKTTTAAKTVSVNIYKVDSQCNLVADPMAVGKDKPMEHAIAKVLESRDSADFTIAGYRLSVENGVATVDLRTAPGSARTFASLSACEQTALFGGIQKTLTSNAQWKVNRVQFTEKGKALVF